MYWNTSFPFSKTKKKKLPRWCWISRHFANIWDKLEYEKGNNFRRNHNTLHSPSRVNRTKPIYTRRKKTGESCYIYSYFFFSSYWLHCAIHIMQFRRFCSGIFGNYARHELLRLCSEQSAWRRVSCTSTYTTDRFLEAVPAWLLARSTRTHRHLLILKYLYSYKKHGTHGIREQLFFCQDR